MKKKYLYIGIGVGACVAILALSLGLYFGLREDDDQGSPPQYTSTEDPATKHPTTSPASSQHTPTEDPTTQHPTTSPAPEPSTTDSIILNNGTQLTPLDEFVYSQTNIDDFSWVRSEAFDFNGTNVVTNLTYQALVLNMTTGYWQTEEEVGERHLWWHVFVVIIPENLRDDYKTHGYIYVSKNDNSRNDGTGMPDGNDDETITEASTMATGVGMPVAICYQVPNQPVYFASDPNYEKRREDEIIAYTWNMYLKNMTNPELNAYFAMARAAVRSIDAMTEFMFQEYGVEMEMFFFTGESKRGWTTWLAGAMENGPKGKGRVKAIVPDVWDGINLQEVFQNQWQSFNGWSIAIEDYVINNITTQLGSPDTFELQNMIDPYFYRTRLTMPKLVVTGLRDEFQMTDDEQYWWDGMPSGPTGTGFSDGNTKWLIKGPNLEHETADRPAIFVHGMWISYILNDWDIPYLTWDYNSTNGDITAHTFGGDVVSASMWHATSCNNIRRDFRAFSLDDPCAPCGIPEEDGCVLTGNKWFEEKLSRNEDNTSYTGHLEPPADGKWSSFILSIQMSTNYTMDLDNPKHTFFTRGDDDMKLNTPITADQPMPTSPSSPPGVFEFTSRGSVVPNMFLYPRCYMESCDGPFV